MWVARVTHAPAHGSCGREQALRRRPMFIGMEDRRRPDHSHHRRNLPQGVEYWRRQRIHPRHQQAMHMVQALFADAGQQCVVVTGGLLQSGQFPVA